MAFQGPTATQGVRWSGSESGDAPEPNWSTASSSVDYGAGDPNGGEFVPTESDVTLSASGEWCGLPSNGREIDPRSCAPALAFCFHEVNIYL